jgi:MarR family transcriptional regulator, organic hydroperoxide resistance regulator
MATTSDDVTSTISRIARVQRTAIAAELAPLGLHPGQDALLRCLWDSDGQTQSQLVATLRVEAPTVTKMVHRLEAAGFVRRRPHAGDRRATEVWLTSAGRTIRTEVNRIRTRVNRRSMAGLSPRQADSLHSLLERVADNLDLA